MKDNALETESFDTPHILFVHTNSAIWERRCEALLPMDYTKIKYNHL